jgi:hypoxanthine phosphoribosyltransferase
VSAPPNQPHPFATSPCGPRQGGAALGDTFLDTPTIAARVSELGAQISGDYQDRDLLLVSILKGGVVFMADLARSIDLLVEMDFLAISSYLQEHSEGGKKAIRFLKDLDQPIKDKNVLVVQDIVDTGLTLHYILRSLSLRRPRSLEVCTLLDRPQQRLVDIDVRYSGFTVSDEFVVGYGFDHRQAFRNVPYLAFLDIEPRQPTLF